MCKLTFIPFKMLSKVYVLLAVAFSSFDSISACNGYTLKLLSVKTCDENSVVIATNGYDVVLDKDCNLAFTGCINVTKPIKTAQGKYLIKKPPLPPLDGDVDFCKVLSQSDFPTVAETVELMGIPKKCPVPAKAYCPAPNGKVSLEPFKNQLGLGVGTTTVKLTADHDSGKTCAEFTFSLSKARKG